MKYAILFSLILGSQAFAHGPVASQASTAVTKATALFLNEEAHDDFQSVFCRVVGDERFSVEFALKDGSIVSYGCGLDETTTPISWGCRKN